MPRYVCTLQGLCNRLLTGAALLSLSLACAHAAPAKLPDRAQLQSIVKAVRKAQKEIKDSGLRSELKSAAKDLNDLLDRKEAADEASIRNAVLRVSRAIRQVVQSAGHSPSESSSSAQRAHEQLVPITAEYEARAFDGAKESGSAARFDQFLVEFPESALASQAREKAISWRFYHAQAKDTQEAYREFLRYHPESRYSLIARLAQQAPELPDAQKDNLLREVKTVRLLVDSHSVHLYRGVTTHWGEEVAMADLETVLKQRLSRIGIAVVTDGSAPSDAIVYAGYTEVHGTIPTGGRRMGRFTVDSFAFVTGVRFRYLLLHPRIGVVSRGEMEVKPESLGEPWTRTEARFRDEYLANFADQMRHELGRKIEPGNSQVQ